MAQGKDTHAAESGKKPGKRPPWWKRLWGWTGFGEKKLWDWLQLFSALAIPVVLAIAGFWFTAQQAQRQREIEDKRAQVEREIEDQRAEHATLQAYLDQMGELMLDRNLRTADENSDVRRLARARTRVVLDALSPSRKEAALRFLDEAELIEAKPPDEEPVIPLKYADLENIELPHRHLLRGADLQQASMSRANLADIDLRGTYLAGAHLEGADLEGAHLEGANLSGAFLEGADLSGANLTDVDFSNAEELWERGTDLWKRGAGLSHANLSDANLSGADLSGASLKDASLKDANVSSEQLAKCESLAGATMPNGQKYEEWLKSKRQAEDGENSGPS